MTTDTTLIAVTGANGFIGRALCRELRLRGIAHRPIVRDGHAAKDIAGAVAVGEIDESTDWPQPLAGVSHVVHCAGIAHRYLGRNQTARDAYETVNVQAVLNLALQSQSLGVERFVFLSSAKVLGAATKSADLYTESKRKAEEILFQIGTKGQMGVVIVRPPLVYGPGVKANFSRLVGAIRAGWPLPFSRIDNKRALIGLDNLVDFLICCIRHPHAAGQSFTVSDDRDLSTPELIRLIHGALSEPKPQLRLFALPLVCLKLGQAIPGISRLITPLMESATLDVSATKETLGWQPPVPAEAGITAAVQSIAQQPHGLTTGPRVGYLISKRVFDFCIAFFAGILLLPLATLIALAIKMTSPGPVLHWSKRIGRDNRIFLMPKFRTMRVEAPLVATHLLDDPQAWLTPIGRSLRKTSLDELPQLWSVVRGDMSLVGPRPALFNQSDLIGLRTRLGVHVLRPGITGWAQINGRDDLSVPQKAAYDHDYLRQAGWRMDFRVLFMTFVSVWSGKGVRH